MRLFRMPSDLGLPRFLSRSSGRYRRFSMKIVDSDLTLSPRPHALVANLLPLILTVIKVKRHLPSSFQSEGNPLSPTAQARLQGLQADPRRLSNVLAAHESPCKTSVSRAVRRLALWVSGIRRLTPSSLL